MNEISYERWRAMMRLPYLVVLAFWVGQRGRLYKGQVARLLRALTEITERDPGDLLGQLADDAGRELTNQFSEFEMQDISHFALQCARSLEAAKAEMTDAQFLSHIDDMHGLVDAVGARVPWHGRLRDLFRGPTAQDPRETLRRALAEAAERMGNTMGPEAAAL